MNCPLRIGILSIAGLILVATAIPTFAQNTPRVELSGGYQWTSYKPADRSTPPLGWYVDVSGRTLPWLGFVWQASGSYDSWSTADQEKLTDTIYTLMGGVRVHGPSQWRVVPFAQALTGAVRFGESIHYERFPQFDDSDAVVALGLQLGGGMDLAFTKRALAELAGVSAAISLSSNDRNPSHRSMLK